MTERYSIPLLSGHPGERRAYAMACRDFSRQGTDTFWNTGGPSRGEGRGLISPSPNCIWRFYLELYAWEKYCLVLRESQCRHEKIANRICLSTFVFCLLINVISQLYSAYRGFSSGPRWGDFIPRPFGLVPCFKILGSTSVNAILCKAWVYRMLGEDSVTRPLFKNK